MHFKMVIVFVEDNTTDDVMKAARKAGATGATVINNARGEGLKQSKTFFGLTLDTQRDVLLFLVEEHLSRHILEEIAKVKDADITAADMDAAVRTIAGSARSMGIDVEGV